MKRHRRADRRRTRRKERAAVVRAEAAEQRRTILFCDMLLTVLEELAAFDDPDLDDEALLGHTACDPEGSS
jgi:hypothetical protein